MKSHKKSKKLVVLMEKVITKFFGFLAELNSYIEILQEDSDFSKTDEL